MSKTKRMNNDQLIRQGKNAYRANRSVNNLRELLKMREINADDDQMASGPSWFEKKMVSNLSRSMMSAN